MNTTRHLGRKSIFYTLTCLLFMGVSLFGFVACFIDVDDPAKSVFPSDQPLFVCTSLSSCDGGDEQCFKRSCPPSVPYCVNGVCRQCETATDCVDGKTSCVDGRCLPCDGVCESVAAERSTKGTSTGLGIRADAQHRTWIVGKYKGEVAFGPFKPTGEEINEETGSRYRGYVALVDAYGSFLWVAKVSYPDSQLHDVWFDDKEFVYVVGYKDLSTTPTLFVAKFKVAISSRVDTKNLVDTVVAEKELAKTTPKHNSILNAVITVQQGGALYVAGSSQEGLFVTQLDTSFNVGKEGWPFVAKVDKDKSGVPHPSVVSALTHTKDGKIVLAGYFQGTLSVGAKSLVAQGRHAICLFALTEKGTLSWVTETLDAVDARALALHYSQKDEDFLLAGDYYGYLRFQAADDNTPQFPFVIEKTAFIMRVGKDGRPYERVRLDNDAFLDKQDGVEARRFSSVTSLARFGDGSILAAGFQREFNLCGQKVEEKDLHEVVKTGDDAGRIIRAVTVLRDAFRDAGSDEVLSEPPLGSS
ncbi:MAG TPA: hypothetical protein DCE42_07370, partial [Myxococcales bacterium]|nr:hypothetical protein [Myxococcales bacterium]